MFSSFPGHQQYLCKVCMSHSVPSPPTYLWVTFCTQGRPVRFCDKFVIYLGGMTWRSRSQKMLTVCWRKIIAFLGTWKWSESMQVGRRISASRWWDMDGGCAWGIRPSQWSWTWVGAGVINAGDLSIHKFATSDLTWVPIPVIRPRKGRGRRVRSGPERLLSLY